MSIIDSTPPSAPLQQPSKPPRLPLFRAEVALQGSDALAGPMRLAQPIAGIVAAAVALLLITALALFITFGSVTRKSRVAGVIAPIGGSATIAATNAGVIAHSHVREGEAVSAGQPLFELASERHAGAGELSALIAQQLAARGASLDGERWARQNAHRLQIQGLRERHANLDAEASKLQQEVRLAQRRHELGRVAVTQQQTLHRAGFVSLAQLQQKMEEWIDTTARLSALERSQVQLESAHIAVRSDISAAHAALASELAQLERSQATLRQEMAENRSRRTTIITAPQAGVVSAIAHRPGQSVNAGQMLARLLPLESTGAPLEAHLYASSRTAGFVDAGQAVLLRYDAFPYQKFGLHRGIVSEVGQMPFAPGELPPHVATTLIGQAQQAGAMPGTSEALYRIRVRLQQHSVAAYGRARALKPGMTLEADITQDRRRLWEWIAEPFLAVRRVATETRRPPVVNPPALTLTGLGE